MAETGTKKSKARPFGTPPISTMRPEDLPSEDDLEIQPDVKGFRLIRKIGEGGMGAVYEAEQLKPKRRVALKILRPGLTKNSFLKRFGFEIEVLAQLEHPLICRLYETGMIDHNQPYFAMEFVEGTPLTEYADRHRLSKVRRIELLIKVIEGVHHAHQKGVIHRDLKPANILVDESGQPKILDFGVAKATESDRKLTTIETNRGMLLGTLPYMSPEQASGESDGLDTRSDVYSLGVIGFELFTQQMPHCLEEKNLHEAVRTIITESPPKLGSIDRRLRGDLETIIAKTLEKDRTRRYSSAHEFASDLRRFLKLEPIIARVPSRAYKVAQFARRNKTLVAGFLVLFTAIVGGIVGTTIGLFKARDAAIIAEAMAERAENGEAAALAEKAKAEQLAVAFLQEQGRRHFLNQDYSAAMVYMHEALKLDPDNRVARYILGAAPRRLNVHAYLPYRGDIQSAEFSSDGRHLLTRTEQQYGYLFNTRTGETIWSTRFPDTLGQPTTDWLKTSKFGPGGDRALLYAGDSIDLFDLNTEKRIKRISLKGSNDAFTTFSPDGKTFFLFNDQFSIYRSQDGELIRRLDHEQLPFFGKDFFSIRDRSWFWKYGDPAERTRLYNQDLALSTIPLAAYTRDGDRLLTAVPDQQEVRVWAVPSGDLLQTFATFGESVHYAQFNRKGDRLIVFSESLDQLRQIEVWNLDNQTKTLTLPVGDSAHRKTHHEFSPDHRFIVSFNRASELTGGVQVEVIDTTSGTRTARISLGTGTDLTDPPEWAIDSGGRRLALQGAREVYNPRNHSPRYVDLYDLKTGERMLQREIEALFVLDRSLVVVVNQNKDLEFYDLEKREVAATIESPTGEWPTELHIDARGRVVAGYPDRTYIWRVSGDKVEMTNQLDLPAKKIKTVFSPDFKFGLLQDNYGAAALVDLTRFPGLVGSYDNLAQFCVDPKSASFAGVRMNPKRLYNTSLRAEVLHPVIGPKGRYLAGHVLRNSGDINVFIWDIVSDSLKASIPGALITGSGAEVIQANENGMAHIWSIETAQKRRTIIVPGLSHFLPAPNSEITRAVLRLHNQAGTRHIAGFKLNTGRPPSIGLWSLETGKLITLCRDSDKMRTDWAIPVQDGRWILSFHPNRQIRLWHGTIGKLAQSWEGTGLCLDAAGERLLLRQDEKRGIVHLATGVFSRLFESDEEDYFFGRDDTLLFERFSVRDAVSGVLLETFHSPFHQNNLLSPNRTGSGYLTFQGRRVLLWALEDDQRPVEEISEWFREYIPIEYVNGMLRPK